MVSCDGLGLHGRRHGALVASTSTLRGLLGTIVVALAVSTGASAHEPVFSLGPETIFEDGVGIESEFELEDAEGERLTVMNWEILYGLRENVALTLKVPHVLEREDDGRTSAGAGDLEARIKYRFFKRDLLGAQHKVSLLFGVKAPTGDEDARPSLGTGTADLLFGLTYGYESRTWYHFVTARYRLRTESGGRDPGDRIFVDPAIGYRPFRREYLEWDLVFLLESNLEIELRDELRDERLPDTGGNRLWLGPTALLSYRNVMLKGGIQFPVYEDLSGDQGESRLRGVAAAEYHF